MIVILVQKIKYNKKIFIFINSFIINPIDFIINYISFYLYTHELLLLLSLIFFAQIKK